MIPASFWDHEQDVSADLRGLISGLGAKIGTSDPVYIWHAESRDVWGFNDNSNMSFAHVGMQELDWGV